MQQHGAGQEASAGREVSLSVLGQEEGYRSFSSFPRHTLCAKPPPPLSWRQVLEGEGQNRQEQGKFSLLSRDYMNQLVPLPNHLKEEKCMGEKCKNRTQEE